jgi:hypothetical protein
VFPASSRSSLLVPGVSRAGAGTQAAASNHIEIGGNRRENTEGNVEEDVDGNARRVLD